MESTSTMAAHPTARWWPGRADLRALVTLAIPVVTVQVGLMATAVVDTIMVGHVSAIDLAAAALGNLYVYGSSAFGMGALMALDPLVAQAVGAGDQPAVARAIQRGLVLSIGLTVITTLAFLAARLVLTFSGQPADVVPVAARFVDVSIAGIIPLFGWFVLRQSLQAMGRMRPIVFTILALNVVNTALCWILVFGHLGFPRLGAVGAGWSTMWGRWATVAVLLLLSWRELKPLLVPILPEAFRPAPLGAMLRLGAPIGVQYMLEFGVFGTIGLLMGHLGAVPMGAHQVAINIASFTFMVPLGISGAAAVLVGQAVGAGDAPRARRSAIAALGSGGAFMLFSGAMLGLFPRVLARVYSSDPEVVALASRLIPIAGVFQVFDGLQVVSIGVLRGVGDTRAPMVVNILGFWLIGLPVSLWLAFGAGFGAVGLWWGFVAGLGAVAIFLVLRVRARLARELRRIDVESH